MRPWILVAALAAGLALFPSAASADRAFSLRYGAVERGDVTMASNTIVTCPEGAANCASARAGTGTVLRNSAWVMVPIDVDGDPSTFDSSSADLRLPQGATILYAGLYWGSDTKAMPEGADAPNPSARGTVRLAAPDGAGYRTVTASTVDSDRYYTSRYQGFADVTALVRTAGAGTYTLANVQASTGKDQYGGWGLVVAYRDSSKPVRWLGLYDGFREFSGGDPADVPISGFKTPASGTVRADFGMLAYEGDVGVSPDSARLNGVDLVDALHDPGNYWNARITEYGQHVTTKNPNYVNQLGMDANIIRADGSLPNNASSALVHMEVSTDLVMPGAMTLVSDQAAAAPVNTAAPSISGTARDGQTLTASNGAWSGTTPMTFAYQWQRCDSSGAACADVDGATASTYTAVAADVGATLRVRVTASNVVGATGATSAQTAAVTVRPPANSSAPTISGTARDGQTLTASTGAWTGTSIAYSYRWLRCDSAGGACAAIANATAATYLLTPSDVGRTIRVEVTGSNSGGSAVATSAQTAAVAARAPVNATPPAIGGSARDGQTLTAADGTWTGTPTIDLAREWLRCDAGGGACTVVGTSAAYVLTAAEVGSTIRVRVTATNAAGSSSATSDPTAVVEAAPPVSTSSPVISGTARDGGALSSTAGGWTGTPAIEFARRWLRCGSDGSGCAAIPDATGAGYSPAAADVGHTIRVEVTATNGGGSSTALSAPSAVVAAAAPANTGAPSITGAARDGQTLTGADGTWSGTPAIVLSRRWLRCESGGACAAIAGATAATYVLGPADVGRTIRLEVTARNDGGSATATSAPTAAVAATGPVNTAAPAVSGTARDTQTLTATDGSWTGTPTIELTRQWQRCDAAGGDCVSIAGATAATYRLTAADVDHAVRVIVTARNSAGSVLANSSPTAAVAPDPPASSSAPTVSGTARDGLALGSTTGGWTGTPTVSLARQWLRCDSAGDACAAIAGATAPAYTLTAADVGRRLRVRVTATNAGGSAEAVSAASAVVAAAPPSNVAGPSIGGTARDGQLLSADPGGWTGTAPIAFAYRWLRCDAGGAGCAAIPGATGPAYELTPDDVTRTLRVEVTGTNGGGSAVASSGQTAAVAAGPPVNSSLPVVSGTARDGQVLTASDGGWSGTPTIAYTRRWRRCEAGGTDCANIPDATGASYELTPADVGHTIRVRVTAANAGGERSAESEPTASVAAIAPSNAQRPVVSGTAAEGELLTVSDGSWTGSAPLAYTYRWERCAVACGPIAGATAASYTLTAADAGARVRAVVTAANPAGSAAAASDQTAAVAAKPPPPSPLDPPGSDPGDGEPAQDPPGSDPSPPGSDPGGGDPPRPAEHLTLAATQWKSTTGTGLRLRVEGAAALDRVAFAIPAAMLPKRGDAGRSAPRRGDAGRAVGRLTAYPGGGRARTWVLRMPRSGGLLLSRRGAPRVALVDGGVRVTGLPAGVALAKLTLYTRDATSPGALLTKGRTAELSATARTRAGELVRAAQRLSG
ncbi:MAG TPA: hypothetical protein VF712_04090 [Thermoleophilaceae bacterium]|jgi:hypothetical protein